jgi:SAM-dependent methyltransferase
VPAGRVSTVTAYQQQPASYDAEAGGGLFAADEPVVAECLSDREPGVALDAACGTGRFAEFLATHGHQVIGVDSSPDMLAHARRRVPDGEFHLAALNQLPLPDDSVDVIVCALALVHVPGLQPVPGGTEPRLPGTKAIRPLSAVCGTSRHSPGITAAGNALENALVRMEIRDDSQLRSVYDKRQCRELLARAEQRATRVS